MYLGLDLGTSGLKALLTDETGTVVDAAEQSYPNPHPRHGWSEQDPADWIAACEAALDTLAGRVPQAVQALQRWIAAL